MQLWIGVGRRDDEVGGQQAAEVDVLAGPSAHPIGVGVAVILKPRPDVGQAPTIELHCGGFDIVRFLVERSDQFARLQ